MFPPECGFESARGWLLLACIRRIESFDDLWCQLLQNVVVAAQWLCTAHIQQCSKWMWAKECGCTDGRTDSWSIDVCGPCMMLGDAAEEGAAHIGSSNRSCCSSKSCLVLCEFLRFTIQLKFCEWSELFKLYIYYMYINCSTISIDVYLHITYFIYVCIWIGLYYLRFAAQLLLVELDSTWT